MLGSAVPATATLHTSTSSATPTSPTRPSRLRGLSYLRTYTHNHLHPQSGSGSGSSRAEAPPLARSTSTPDTSPRQQRAREVERSAEGSHIQSGENGWLPTVQGRSGLSRESLQPTSTTRESASPETSMTRSRAATAVGPTPAAAAMARRQSAVEASSSGEASAGMAATPNAGPAKEVLPSIKFIPHVEPRSTRPSLHFTAMSRTLKTQTSIVRVGRYSERDNASPDPATVPVGFKSKVVSRRHCELWCTNGQWYIKDVKSSSGTFLNHVRLSPPGQESRPYTVNDGDVVQLGIDFKGGEEVIFRCVKIRIECNRGWQKSLNAYNTTAHKRLLKNALGKKSRDSDAASVNSSECSICLNQVRPCQALFVAPCSHVWHYKCVRNLVHGPSYPNFLCPNCRFVADLEADVEPEEDEEDFDEDEDLDVADLVQKDTANGDAQPGGLSEDDGMHANGRRGSFLDDEDEDETEPTPAADRGANVTDEELAGFLHQTFLHASRQASSTALSPPQSQLDVPIRGSSVTASQPVSIAGRQTSSFHTPTSSVDMLGARSTTPTSHTQFALAAGSMPDGPMTPRNDAGPFVLDGSGGRDREARGRLDGVVTETVREESEPRSPEA